MMTPVISEFGFATSCHHMGSWEILGYCLVLSMILSWKLEEVFWKHRGKVSAPVRKHGLTAVLGTNVAFPRRNGRVYRPWESDLHWGWCTTALNFNSMPGLVRPAGLNALLTEYIRSQLLKTRCFSKYISRQAVSAVSLRAGRAWPRS